MKKLVCLLLLAPFISCEHAPGKSDTGADPLIGSLETFGTMGKELQVLTKEEESVLFSHEGKGCITHMWFGGDLNGYEDMLIRVYVDGEERASIEMELFLGHGIGFKDPHAPWGTELMGNMGQTSGIYNTTTRSSLPFLPMPILASVGPHSGG